MEDEHNPYAPPAADVDDVSGGAPTDAERIRREHINHETSVKSIGYLFLLGALGLVIGGVGLLAGGTGPRSQQNAGAESEAELLGMGIGFCFMAVVYLITAVGLQRLRPWARIVGAIFCALSLCSIPFGTLMGLYCLYLLLSAKGSTVFSREYQDVISVTPHVKYKHSPVMIGILVLLLLLLLGSVLFAALR